MEEMPEELLLQMIKETLTQDVPICLDPAMSAPGAAASVKVRNPMVLLVNKKFRKIGLSEFLQVNLFCAKYDALNPPKYSDIFAWAGPVKSLPSKGIELRLHVDAPQLFDPYHRSGRDGFDSIVDFLQTFQQPWVPEKVRVKLHVHVVAFDEIFITTMSSGTLVVKKQRNEEKISRAAEKSMEGLVKLGERLREDGVASKSDTEARLVAWIIDRDDATEECKHFIRSMHGVTAREAFDGYRSQFGRPL